MKQFLLFLLIASLTINVFQYIQRPEIITKTTVDTLYVQLPSEIIVKEKIITKYTNIHDIIIDSSEINKLNDSLKQLDRYISELISQLIRGDIVTMFDTTKFQSGDSIQTTVLCWPINEINYKFFPRPDKIVTITNNNFIVDKWGVVPGIGIYKSGNYLYLNLGLGIKHYSNIYSIEYGLSFNNSSIIGLSYQREFTTNNLFKLRNK